MNELQEIFFQNIEEKCHGIYKQKAYMHSLKVCALAQKLALDQGLDIEIAGIMGLFHDYSQFIRHSSFQHASISSELTKDILMNQGFDEEKIDIIVKAIAHHSDKDVIDDVYSEILKDADVLAQYFTEPERIYKESYQKRLKKYLDVK